MTETIKKEKESEVIIEVDEKPYHFRKLEAPDIFPMFKIINKIGVNEFSACLEKDSIKDLVAAKGGDVKEDAASIVGISVALEIANIILGNLPKCEEEIFQMLASVSGLSVKEIKAFDIATFAEMVIDFIKKDDFKDFFKVVSRLFK
jgi:hypothetical protein